jgi:hypothetical protein
MGDFIADTRRSPSALGHRGIKTTEVRTGVNPSTSKHGGTLWIVGMVRRHLRMTDSKPAHSQYILNGLGGGYADVVGQCKKTADPQMVHLVFAQCTDKTVENFFDYFLSCKMRY